MSQMETKFLACPEEHGIGKGYGNLAASISSTKKSSTSSILTILTLRSSALLVYLKLPVPLVVGRL